MPDTGQPGTIRTEIVRSFVERREAKFQGR